MQTGINKRGLGGLAFGHLAIDMQTSSLAVMIPLLLINFRLDYTTAALIVTVNTVTSYALQPFFGLLSDRKPMRWLLPMGCLLAAGGMVAVLFMPDYWLVLLAVMVSGIGAAIYHPEGSRNANFVSGDKKASGMSFFFFCGNMGSALGPIVLTILLGIFGTSGAVGMLIPGLIGGLLLWRLLPLYGQYTPKRNQRRAVTGVLAPPTTRAGMLGLLAMLLSIIGLRSMVQTGLITFIPLYFIAQSSTNKEYAAFLLSVFVFCAAIGTLIGGPLADRLGHRTVMVATLVLVMPLLLVFLNSSGPIQVIALGLAGITLVAASSLTIVMAQDLLPNNIGLATGLTLGLGFGAGGLGAAALGKYADAFGLGQTLLVIALIPIALVVMSLLIPYKTKNLAVARPENSPVIAPELEQPVGRR